MLVGSFHCRRKIADDDRVRKQKVEMEAAGLRHYATDNPVLVHQIVYQGHGFQRVERCPQSEMTSVCEDVVRKSRNVWN